MLALVAPVSWFVAALIWTVGIGRLPGELYWVSGVEGFIMTLGSPFFAATFVFMGQFVANEFAKTGIWITVLGLLGVSTLCAIASFRLFVTVFVAYGLPPDTIWKAFDADSTYYLPFLLFQLSGFLSFVLTGLTLLRMPHAPKWAGILLILSIPLLVTGQFFLHHTEIFWPLATGCWVVALLGLVRQARK